MATILLVDDEENILKLCKVELEEEGYEVIALNGGKEAVEAVVREIRG